MKCGNKAKIGYEVANKTYFIAQYSTSINCSENIGHNYTSFPVGQ